VRGCWSFPVSLRIGFFPSIRTRRKSGESYQHDGNLGRVISGWAEEGSGDSSVRRADCEVDREPQGHLQGIGAIIMVRHREVLQLLDQQCRSRGAALEAQLLLREVGAQAAELLRMYDQAKGVFNKSTSQGARAIADRAIQRITKELQRRKVPF
jgi:hypothetical protein